MSTQLDDEQLSKELLEKFENGKTYKYMFLTNHYKYVQVRRGMPLEVYEKLDESGENFIKPLTTANLQRITKKLRQLICQGNIQTKVKSTLEKDSDEEVIANYIVKHILLTDSTGNEAAFINKLGMMIEDALSFAYAPAWIDFKLNLNNEPEVKLKQVTYADYFPEPDQASLDDINYAFVRIYYSKQDLENLKDAWNGKAISKVTSLNEDEIEDLRQKSPEVKFGTKLQRDNTDLIMSYNAQLGYPILVYMDKKKDGEVVYMSEQTGEILFRHPNYDKTGSLRMKAIVNDLDSAGALGHSLYEPLLDIQNAQDTLLQLIQWQTLLEADPPYQASDPIDGMGVYLRPGQMNWFNPGGGATPMRTTNQTLDSATMAEKLYSGIMTNATGVDDISIPALGNASALSKTDTGVKEQRSSLDLVTNYHDTILKEFLSDYLTTAYKVFTSYSKALGLKKLSINCPDTMEKLSDYIKNEDGTVDVDFDSLQIHKVEVIVGAKQYGSAEEKVDALQKVLNIINSASDYNPVTEAIVYTVIKELDLKDDQKIKEAMEQWRTQAIQKQQENLEQQKNQNELMRLQIQEQQLNIQNQAQMQPHQNQMQMEQDQVTHNLMPLQQKAQEDQLKLQIAQEEQQLQNPQQAGQSPGEGAPSQLMNGAG